MLLAVLADVTALLLLAVELVAEKTGLVELGVLSKAGCAIGLRHHLHTQSAVLRIKVGDVYPKQHSQGFLRYHNPNIDNAVLFMRFATHQVDLFCCLFIDLRHFSKEKRAYLSKDEQQHGVMGMQVILAD